MERFPFASRSLSGVLLAFTFLGFIGVARPAEAQPCVSDWTCSLVMSCDAGSTATCQTITGCACVAMPCNNNTDCNNGAVCNGNTGKCEASSEACSTDSQCAAGKMCGSRGVCINTPAPEPCTDAKCNDGNACNGIETCDGLTCRSGMPPSCSDGNDVTSDYCRADSGASGYRCEHVGPSRCSSSPIANPVVRFGPARGGVRGFVMSGVMATKFAQKPPTDLPSGSVRVMLFDKTGRTLVDTTVDASSSSAKGGWRQDAKGGWSYQNAAPNAAISRMTFREPTSRTTFGTSFEVIGSLPPGAIAKYAQFGAGGALIIDWTGDISGPCGAVVVPLCSVRNMDGADWMVCRGRSLRP